MWETVSDSPVWSAVAAGVTLAVLAGLVRAIRVVGPRALVAYRSIREADQLVRRIAELERDVATLRSAERRHGRDLVEAQTRTSSGSGARPAWERLQVTRASVDERGDGETTFGIVNWSTDDVTIDRFEVRGHPHARVDLRGGILHGTPEELDFVEALMVTVPLHPALLPGAQTFQVDVGAVRRVELEEGPAPADGLPGQFADSDPDPPTRLR